MALSWEDVLRLMRMARFEVAPEQIERYRIQLNAVIERIDELELVASEAEVPDAPAADAQEAMRLRDDVAAVAPLPRGVEAFSDDVVAGFFTVPRAAPAEGAKA